MLLDDMGRTATSSPDPALERLREVADRIRRRAAEDRRRASGEARKRVVAVVPPPAPTASPPPPHWADGPDGSDDNSH